MSERPNRGAPPLPGTARAARAARPKFQISFEDFLEDLRDAGVEDFQSLDSWSNWLVLAKVLTGVKLTEPEMAIFTLYTGRTKVLPRYSECLAIVGRQSGKSRIATALAAYFAGLARRTQTPLGVALVSQDHAAARAVLLAYFRSLFAAPMLKSVVAKQVRDEIHLKNGYVLRTFPCDPAAVRGPRNVIAILDEIGFYRSKDGQPMSLPMLRALRPNSDLILALSSSMVEGSPVDLLATEHWGRSDSPVLVWRSETAAMNPTYDPVKLAMIEAIDPQGFEEEFMGVTMRRSTRFLERAVVLSCTERSVFERPPVARTQYTIAIDASQRQEDSFVVTVWHQAKDEAGTTFAVQDVVREFEPVKRGADPELKKVAAYIKYLRKVYPGPNLVYGDQANLHYVSSDLAPELRCIVAQVKNPATDLAGSYDPDANMVRQTTNMALSRARTAFLQGRVRLLDQPRQIQQWCSLQLKRSPSGQIKIEAASGQHDDVCAAGAIAISQLAEPSMMAAPAVGSGPGYSPDYGLPAGQSAIYRAQRGPLTREQREDLQADHMSKRLENQTARNQGRPLPWPEHEPKVEDLVEALGFRGSSGVLGRAVGPKRRNPYAMWDDAGR